MIFIATVVIGYPDSVWLMITMVTVVIGNADSCLAREYHGHRHRLLSGSHITMVSVVIGDRLLTGS